MTGHRCPPLVTEHSEQAHRYLARAGAIRAQLPTMQDEEVINELYVLAVHYERLADFADAAGPLASFEGMTGKLP